MITVNMKLFNSFGKWYIKILTTTLFTGLVMLTFYMISCQDLNFQSIPGASCDETIEMVDGLSCGDVGGVNADTYEYEDEDEDEYEDKGSDPNTSQSRPFTLVTRLGKISILFIIDTSGSMKEELASISTQFDPFLQKIRRMDYQVAITTVESINGQFLTFENGQKILSNPTKKSSVHKENVKQFQQKMENLPVATTSDERAIFVLNKVLDAQAQSGFFPSHSLFLAIIVSDEDERSYGGVLPSLPSDCMVLETVSAHPLEEFDKPVTFFRKSQQQLPYVTVTVHSIIVPPGSSDCATNPCAPSGVRIEGKIYAQASKPSSAMLSTYGNVRTGHIGSICSSDYSSQLGPIADILINTPSIPLHCNPVSGKVKVRVGGDKVKFRVEGNKIIIEESVSFNSYAKVRYYCRS